MRRPVMNAPDPGPTDEQLAALLGAIEKDHPPPNLEFLDRLREQTQQAFQMASAPTIPTSLWKRIMLKSSIRWVASSAAVLLILGIVIARWFGAGREPIPLQPGADE